MRLAILSLFLSVGIMAHGQSTASGSASPDQQWKGPSSTSVWREFDKLPPRWQVGITGPVNTFTPPDTSFLWQEENAQGDSRMHFHLPQLDTGAALETQFLAQNVYPSRSNILSQWPNLKIEPIPTQWPNAKLEAIPTQWADLTLLPADTRSSKPSALQDSSNWSVWNFPH
jgi:hypothetical protein